MPNARGACWPSASASGMSMAPVNAPAAPMLRFAIPRRTPLGACGGRRRSLPRWPSMAQQRGDFGRFSSKRASRPGCYRPPVPHMLGLAWSRSLTSGPPGGAPQQRLTVDSPSRPRRGVADRGPGDRLPLRPGARQTSRTEHHKHSRNRTAEPIDGAESADLAARDRAQHARSAAADCSPRCDSGH